MNVDQGNIDQESMYGYTQQTPVGQKRERPNDSMNGMEHQKKAKTDGKSEPSKVIHMRSLPADVTETEVKALGLPFGRVTNILLMRQKHQAFIQLESIENASTMINYYDYVAPTIRQHPICLQFSQHQELRTRQQDGEMSSEQDKGILDGSSTGGKTVLKVIVSNIVYPVTIEILQQVFQRCGEILKIVTFLRNEQFHALIQYSNAKEAAAAKNLFDRQNIYNGCNTLTVEFSRLDNLNVKYNNEKMRDFTKPNLGKAPQDQLMMDQVAAAQMQMAAMSPGMLPNPYTPPLFPQNNPSAGGAASFGLSQYGQLPNMSPNSLSMQPPFVQHSHVMKGGSVLLVSNLSEDEINCDDLFILFGHYGDVQRVKILFNKKDTALIQFTDYNQAQAAQQNLNGVRLYGKEMRVSRSKHDNVNMPKSEDEGKELTKDYQNSPLHRFKKPGSKNFQNIFPPIRTLHLSNIPESTTEDELKALFTEHGTISNFRFFPKDRRMALIQMDSTDESLICLMRVHNYKLSESSHLRVSFAKNEM